MLFISLVSDISELSDQSSSHKTYRRRASDVKGDTSDMSIPLDYAPKSEASINDSQLTEGFGLQNNEPQVSDSPDFSAMQESVETESMSALDDPKQPEPQFEKTS